jgi:folate-binding protein YgfZ
MASLDSLTPLVCSSAAVHVTSDRIFRVQGDDAHSWLSGQITADIRGLKPGHAVYALCVTVKGRIVSDLWVIEQEGLHIVLPERCAEDALATLEKHIIMEDVELVPVPERCVVSVQGPLAREVVTDAGLQGVYAASRLCEAGLDAWLPRGDAEPLLKRLADAAQLRKGRVVDAADWGALHVALAVPRAGIDFNGDAYPQEAGLKARAVAFNKGCYQGQEVVYMLENRGQLSRRLVQLEGPEAALTVGAQLMDAEGKKVGQVTSAARKTDGQALALAYAKKPHWDTDVTLHTPEGVVRVTHIVGSGSIVCPVIAT